MQMHRLIDESEAVEDPRIGNAKKHKLGDILFIVIAAGVADADTWNQIEDYAIEHEEFFRQYLELPAGIPSPRHLQSSLCNYGFARSGKELPELDSTICQNKGRLNYKH